MINYEFMMKKFCLAALLLTMLFAGCKKESTLTADGKPKSDATNNVLRVDVSSDDNYTFGVTFTYTYPPSEATTLAYMRNAGPYEYVTTAVVGQTADIYVDATYGSNITCVIYYKGSKVPMDEITKEKITGDPTTPSVIHVTYDIDK